MNMLRTWSRNQICQYVTSKLIGSGVLYLSTILIIKGFHFEDWPSTAKNPLLWFCYYGYATIWSILVDFLTRKIIPEDRILYKIPLYLFGGILPFVVMMGGLNLFSMIASLIGVACASIYYGVSNYAYHAKKLWPYSGILSLAMTVFLIVLVFLK